MDIIRTPDEVIKMASKREIDTQKEISAFNQYYEIIKKIIHTISSPIPHCDGWRGVFLSKSETDQNKSLWATVSPSGIYEITHSKTGEKISSSQRMVHAHEAVADYDLIICINRMIETLEAKQELTDKRKAMREALSAKLDDFRRLVDSYKDLTS